MFFYLNIRLKDSVAENNGWILIFFSIFIIIFVIQHHFLFFSTLTIGFKWSSKTPPSGFLEALSSASSTMLDSFFLTFARSLHSIIVCEFVFDIGTYPPILNCVRTDNNMHVNSEMKILSLCSYFLEGLLWLIFMFQTLPWFVYNLRGQVRASYSHLEIRSRARIVGEFRHNLLQTYVFWSQHGHFLTWVIFIE